MTPAGAHWCALYPTSTSLDDLAEPFQSNCRRFIEAIESAGGSVNISATYRPPERAYLMHYCCMIAQGKQDPACIAPMPGVDIDWGCVSPEVSKAACEAMMQGYGIVFPAALQSRHTQRLAIDMTITGFHLSGQDLWDYGKSFGVVKLVSDPPHWSSDGH